MEGFERPGSHFMPFLSLFVAVLRKEVKAIEAEHNDHLKDRAVGTSALRAPEEYNAVKGKMEKKAEEFKEFERQDARRCF